MGEGFLGEEFLLLKENIDFMCLLEGLYLLFVLKLALCEFLGSFLNHLLFVSDYLP
jgi:hypothetical protein